MFEGWSTLHNYVYLHTYQSYKIQIARSCILLIRTCIHHAHEKFQSRNVLLPLGFYENYRSFNMKDCSYYWIETDCIEHDAANVKFFTHYTGKQLYNTKSNNILLQILLHNPCKYCPIFAMNKTTVYKNRVRTYIACLCSVQNRVSIFTAIFLC